MTLDEIVFLVQGREADPYRVSFRKSGPNITARCTCLAGGSGMHCKHRLSILAGKQDGIVSGNADQVAAVTSWLPGTDVEAAMEQLREAEAQVERAKKAVAEAKLKIARAMED